MNLGKAIKELRKHKGISQKELAIRCGISTNAICSLENNDSFPSKNTFEKICKALGIPGAYIFLFSISEEDIPESKRELYKLFIEQPLKGLVLDDLREDSPDH